MSVHKFYMCPFSFFKVDIVLKNMSLHTKRFFTKSKVVTLVAAVSWYVMADEMQKLAYYY